MQPKETKSGPIRIGSRSGEERKGNVEFDIDYSIAKAYLDCKTGIDRSGF
jgi:hypothetical protein